jgi:hypothetical protein
MRSPAAQVVHGARDQLFPGARLAEDEDRRVGRRDHLELVEHAAERLAPADNAVANRVLGTAIPDEDGAGVGPSAR